MIFKSIIQPKQFGDAPQANSVLQHGVNPSIKDTGKYAVAFVKESGDVEYFEVPDHKKNGIWMNGLDDKSVANECLALYDKKARAIESLQSKGLGYINQGFYKGRIYETVYHQTDGTLAVLLARTPTLELLLVEEFTK